MKKYKEWLTNEIEIMESETSENYPHEQMVEREVVLSLINQLDEPEVLSQKWIDKNKKYGGVHDIGYYIPVDKLYGKIVPKQEEVDRAYKDGYEKGREHGFYKGYREGLGYKGSESETLSQENNINIVLDDLKEHIKEQQSLSQNVGLAHTSAGNDTHYRQYDYVLECINEYEPSDDLQNLIVPKQELPVIPKYVAKYLEFAKSDVSLMRVMVVAYSRDELPEWEKEYDWISENSETFAKAWLDGYEVEEQKYYVLERDEEYGGFWFLTKNSNGKISIGVGRDYYEVDWDRLKLTEQEIKDYDERFWAFAEPIEQVDFRLSF